jgi:putative phosphonate catabolism associated alcohol dehydrogenase
MNLPPQTIGKALLFEGPELPLRLVEQPFPAPLEGEVVVRVEAATLCGSDLHTINGKRRVETPTVLGHETIGRIEAMGPGPVPRLQDGTLAAIGDRITWAVVANCGGCRYCDSDLPQKCERAIKYGHEPLTGRRMWTGGLATWNLLAPGTTLIKLPESLPASLGTPASCATATVMAGFEALGPIEGKNLLITGAGMLGLTAVARARAFRPASITVVDPVCWRRDQAFLMGCSSALTPVEFSNHAQTVDAWLELSGSNASWESCFPRLTVGATVALIGAVFPTQDTAFNLERVVRRMITIRGIHNYGPRHLAGAVEFLTELPADHPLGQLAGPWFTLDQHETALRVAADPAVLRVGFMFR